MCVVFTNTLLLKSDFFYLNSLKGISTFEFDCRTTPIFKCSCNTLEECKYIYNYIFDSAQ